MSAFDTVLDMLTRMVHHVLDLISRSDALRVLPGAAEG